MLIMRDACLVSKMVGSSEPSNCSMTYDSTRVYNDQCDQYVHTKQCIRW